MESFLPASHDIPPGGSPDSQSVTSHGPPNKHGTYLDSFDDGFEPLDRYEEGGFHPVYLNDTFGVEGRYRVLQKLGHGGFGTVWLCRDDKTNTYVVLKVLISYVNSEDELFDLKLTRLDRSSGWEYITMPLDHFFVTGPNGKHHCLILPVLGPRVSPDLFSRLGERTDTAAIYRAMARQATQALGFLHKHKICHGDFRAANILVKLKGIDLISETEIMSRIGEPVTAQVLSESEELPLCQPKYLVEPIELADYFSEEYLAHEISVIDFGESYYFDDPPEFLGMPEHYLPPEEILLPDETDRSGSLDGHGDSNRTQGPELEDSPTPLPDAATPLPSRHKSKVHTAVKGPACDLWALGCAFYEIRNQKPLFYMIPGREELLVEVVRLFGKLPQVMWDHQWEARKKWFDDEGNLLRKNRGEVSLEKYLSPPSPKPGRKVFYHNQPILEAERKLLADLIYRLLRYEPSERASIDEVLAHDWFKLQD